MKWEFGTGLCKLLSSEQLNIKVLQYSVGYCIQYLLINYNKVKYKTQCHM